jgi:protein tyrosine phosphatase (PTP) superfamily phosphohydrolase (DUF442 family)
MQWTSRTVVTRAACAAGVLAVVVAAACRSDDPAARDPARPAAQARLTLDEHGAPVGLQNFKKWSDKLSQGGQPEGEEAFGNLAALGFTTIVTVDGARPDIETAERYGLRYVHIPIGYDGVPKDAQVRIVRAVAAADGPVYVHCHHGTARGPAAAAVARVALEGATNEEALEGLRDSGCAAAYKGLFRDVVTCVAPTAEELARVPANQPSYVPPGDVAVAMVGADMRFDRLKLSKNAKWGVPANHPDVDPPHEATMLWEQFKEIARLPDAKRRGDEFLKLLGDAERSAKTLEGAIQRNDADAADAAQTAVKQSCDACHAKFRNN